MSSTPTSEPLDGRSWFPPHDRLADLRRDTLALVSQPLPLPAGGRTARRWQALYRWARTGPVSVARLAEAHLDALAILAEAGAPGSSDGPGGPVDPAGRGDAPDGDRSLYGVWASGGPANDLRFEPTDGTITGIKRFCSGLGIVDRALVTADDGHGATWLLDVDLTTGPSLRAEPGPWTTPALADTATGTLHTDRHRAEPVGVAGWYLSRPGFWHGAIGPAACWAGAAAGLVDQAEARVEDDPYRRAAQGELRAWDLACRTLLDAAGHASDAAPLDGDAARYRALANRHAIERAATVMADRFSQAFGPRPFVTDAGIAQRIADLHLYLRQHHGQRDLVDLASLPPLPAPGDGH